MTARAREVRARSIHTGEQYVPALCERVSGKETAECLYGNIIDGLSVVTITARQCDQSPELTYHGEGYPTIRLVSTFLHIARSKGVTAAVRPLASRLIPEIVQIPDAEVVSIPVEETELKDPKPASLIASVCKELKMEPTVARRILRAAGLHAPYNDRGKILEILTRKENL